MEGKYLKFCPVCNKTGQNSMDWCFNEKSIEFVNRNQAKDLLAS